MKDTCILTGVVDSIANTTYGNLYLSDGTAQVYVYGVLTADKQSKKFSTLDVAVGDTMTILAIYNEYNNAPQVTNAIFVSREKAVVASVEYYLAGSMNNWAADTAYQLLPNTEAEGEYMLPVTFAANDEFKVIGVLGDDITWYPGGQNNNYVITEAGDYTVYFRPEGNVEGWHEGFFYAEKVVDLPDPTNCAEAREAALSVSDNNVAYKDSTVYTIQGYVTIVATNWGSGKMTFWMADSLNGGRVLEAYKCSVPNEQDAVHEGDLVAVTGVLTKYNDTPEFAAGCTVEIIERAEYEEPVNLGAMTIGEFLALANRKDTCILTGVVDSIANTTYGNLYLSDETGTVYVYGVLTADGRNKQFASLDVEVGDQLTILAIYNEYNNAPQVTNAIFVSRENAVVASVEYYLAGSMNNWAADTAYQLLPNTEAEGEYMLPVTFAANDEFKVIGVLGETTTWYPGGQDNNYVITEAGDYTVYFRPEGNSEWGNGYFTAIKEVAPVLPDPTSCAEAREFVLALENNESYNNGAQYTLQGYVTGIKTLYSEQYHNVSFWIADTVDGGEVLQAYRAVCASEADAPNVGDKVAVTGQLLKYNNTAEFAAGCTFTIIERTALPENLGDKTIAEFLALADTRDTCILTGVVDTVLNTRYGNLYLSDGTAQVYVYGLLTADKQAQKFSTLDVEQGDRLTILAVYSLHEGAPQVKNAVFVSRIKHSVITTVENAEMINVDKIIRNGQVLIIRNGVEYTIYGTKVK